MIERQGGGGRLFVAAAAAVAALVGISGLSVAPFTEPATPTDGVVQIAWWVCFVMAIWFVGSVLLWRLALRSRRNRWRRLATRFALPGSRKLAESTLALSLIFGAGACSLGPDNNAPALSLVATGVEAEPGVEPTTAPTTTTAFTETTLLATTLRETTLRETTTSISPQESPADETPPQPDSAEPSPARPEFNTAYQVRAGDNLWIIAEQTLRTATDAEPTAAEVAIYWRQVIAHVRDSIKSGEPNLIYPGEVLNLPDPA